MSAFTIFNARLIDPALGTDEHGGVQIVDGRLADVGPHLATIAASTRNTESHMDAQGQVLAPGLIDSRVHLCDPGATHLETLDETLAGAVRGGITTVIGLPNTLPAVDRRSALGFNPAGALAGRITEAET